MSSSSSPSNSTQDKGKHKNMGTGASKSNGVSLDVEQLVRNNEASGSPSASSISKQQQSQQPAQQQQQQQSQELSGAQSLETSEFLLENTGEGHAEGNACPFCGLSGVAAAELLLHVNQAHLDYLTPTPENEVMGFIDDQTPSVDGDSDSMSECSSRCNGYSNNYRTHNGHGVNGIGNCSKNMNGSSSSSNGVLRILNDSDPNSQSAGSSSTTNKHQILNNLNNNNNSNSVNGNLDNLSSKNCDMSYGLNGERSANVNGEQQQQQQPHGGEGSPLRNFLSLKLKSNKPKAITTNNLSASNVVDNLTAIAATSVSVTKQLQCLLCPYQTDNTRILEEHINRSHFDPLSPSVNSSLNQSEASHMSAHTSNTTDNLQCPICIRYFQSCSDLELHVNIEHKDILSPAKLEQQAEATNSLACPVCSMEFENSVDGEKKMHLHIENHFAKSPSVVNQEPDLEKQAQKLREQREFEALRAQYGMDDHGNFREQSCAAMQRAVYAGEMSVADYYERQVGLRAAESHGVDDGSSCTKSVAPRVLTLSCQSPGVIKSFVCSGVDHYASSYGDKGWGCGYRNLQMMLSSLLQNTTYNEALYSAWGSHAAMQPARTAMPSISRLQKMVEAAWAQGFDVQGKEQLGCKLYNTRKWIGATEIVTVLSWLRIQCQLVDFHKPGPDGKHLDLFNWVLRYFEEPKIHTPPLYLQHQGHSRTIIGVEQRSSGLTLLVLDPSHMPRQMGGLGSSQDSLRLIRRGPNAMKAPQYQIVAVIGLIKTEEEYQASKVLKSLRIP